ncbi:MAG: FHA domain-containing protein [Kiritimatiellae bacterium]|nr:FHA domain-containing protein [Kiritimatiellia bacterium]
MAKRPELLITSGPMSGTRFEVGAGGVRLGRSSSNDVHIPDEELSRNHCLFEQSGEAGIRVTDLASANGTFVNGEQLGSDSRELKPSDMIEVGSTAISVVGDEPPPTPLRPAPVAVGAAIDLGLGTAPTAASQGESASRPSAKKPGGHPRAMLANVLWIVAALVVAAAIAVVLCTPRDSEKPVVSPVVEEKPEKKLISLSYEKIEADAARVFSYRMDVDSAGVLHVAFDDVPGENRHVDKKAKLSEKAMKRILEVLDRPGFAALDDAYTGSSAEVENALKSFRIRVVRWNSIKDVLVENTQEPDAFREVRESLEAFSRNELGIWAIQYSKEKLIELSEESAKVGDTKWEDREVEYGNLSASVKAYKDALFYLETVNPKPESFATVKERLARSEAELKQRYEDQRFLVDKAINLGDWEVAQTELKILCELVPERDDPRHAEANARLVDVENRMKKARGGK